MAWPSLAELGLGLHGLTWLGVACPGLAGVVWLGFDGPALAWLCLAQTDLVYSAWPGVPAVLLGSPCMLVSWLGLAWPGLTWLGMAWPGMGWLGRAWLSLEMVWIGLQITPK